LWRDGLLARLDLEPLSPESTGAMVEAALDGPLDARSAKRFWRLTGGNALFVQQLLKDQVAAGRIRRVAGVWIWDGGVAVSQNMSDLVGNQLDRLPTELALVVDTLSQCEPLSVDVLAALVGRGELEKAEQMHLITVDRTGDTLVARLAHPLFGELRRAKAGEMYLSKVRGCAGAAVGRWRRERSADHGSARIADAGLRLAARSGPVPGCGAAHDAAARPRPGGAVRHRRRVRGLGGCGEAPGGEPIPGRPGSRSRRVAS